MKKEISKPLVVFALSCVVLVGIAIFSFVGREEGVLSSAQLNALIESRGISHVTVCEDRVEIATPKEAFTLPKEAVDLPTLYRVAPVGVCDTTPWGEIVFELLLIGAVGFSVMFMWKISKSRGGQNTSLSPDQSDPLGVSLNIVPTTSTVTFKDVAGIDEVKQELFDIIDFLSHPKKYTQFGIRVPKGVILAGPPGVGKTMIAKAVAGEAKVPFFYQSGSSFVQIFVGVGAKRVRELFAQAKKHAPAIIFIDEIDAVGKARGGNRSDEREATLNQLLTEMDGFEENTGVIVIAATNKIEMLDEALLRAGRFDRRVFVGFPDISERKKIAQLYLKRVPNSVDLNAVGAMSVGFSAAGMENLINEAALFALKQNKTVVTTDDVMAVRDRVLVGSRKLHTFGEDERAILSLYMASRAFVGFMVDESFDKMSLVGNSDPKMDGILSKTALMGRVHLYMAGLAGCMVLSDELYSLGEEDLAKAKELVSVMVQRFGMGSSIGECDVQGVLESAFDETKQMIEGELHTVEKIAAILLENEVVYAHEIKALRDNVL